LGGYPGPVLVPCLGRQDQERRKASGG
jgi:hypothetical protein